MKNKQGSLGNILSGGVVIFIAIMVYFQIPNEVKEGAFQMIKTNPILRTLTIGLLFITIIAIFLAWVRSLENINKRKEGKK